MNNRYLKAFIITIFVYISLIMIFIYIMLDKNIKTQSAKKSLNRVKITILTKKSSQKQVKKISKSKIKHKKLLRKIKNKSKKAIKKIKSKKILKKKSIKNNIKKEQKFIPKKQIKQKLSKTNIGVNEKNKKIIDQKKQKYYELIKETIAENKIYPRSAIRRKIQGSVKVKFLISSDGKLLKIDIISGKEIFYNALKKTIINSFPIIPPKNLFLKDFILTLTIEYRLY